MLEQYVADVRFFFSDGDPRTILRLSYALSKKYIPAEVKETLLDTCLDLLDKAHGQQLTRAALLLSLAYKLCDPATPYQKAKCTSTALIILSRVLTVGTQPENSRLGNYCILSQAPAILERVKSAYDYTPTIKNSLFYLQLRTAETAVGRLIEEPLSLLEDAAMTAAGDHEKEARLLYTVTNMLPRFMISCRSEAAHQKMVKIVSDLSGVPIASQVALKAHNLFIPRLPPTDQTGKRITSYAVRDGAISFNGGFDVFRQQSGPTSMVVLLNKIRIANKDAFYGLRQDEITNLDPAVRQQLINEHEEIKREKPANEAIFSRAAALFKIRNKFPSPCEALARLMAQKRVKPELLSKFRAEIALREPSTHP